MTVELAQIEKKNVLLLALCQALAMTGNIILFTIATLIGYSLAEDKSLATFPLALQQLATMSTTIPASLLMNRFGRQLGFIIGVFVGLSGASLGIYAVFWGSFPVFCLANLLFGVFNGFAGFYRFAAADAASEAFRSRAISFVMAGGVLAALLGPVLATWSKDLFKTALFAGSLASIVGLQLLTLVVLQFVDIPQLSPTERKETGRVLSVIVQQPIFIVALLGSMLGYGVMAMIMTATPLAMVAHSHSFDSAAFVIQWHVLGMFAPSFITGYLITRFGVLNIILCGVILNALCMTVNLIGTEFLNFWIALLLLGVGWNFIFIGSTVLLTEAYTPAEKSKTQAFHDFLMFGFVTLTVFSSGRLLDSFGWKGVNYASIPMLLLMLAAILQLRLQQSKVD